MVLTNTTGGHALVNSRPFVVAGVGTATDGRPFYNGSSGLSFSEVPIVATPDGKNIYVVSTTGATDLYTKAFRIAGSLN